MRKRALIFSGLFLMLGGVSIRTVSAASTDCDKWLREYKQALADSQPVKRLVSAKHHIRHAVTPEKPRVVRASSPVHHIRTPKLSPQEMLRRFHILCGDLPPSNEVGLVPETPLQMLVPRAIEIPMEALAPPVTPTPPTYASVPPTQVGLVVTPPLGITPPVISIPLTPGTPIKTLPSEELPPTSPIGPVVPPVPEPSSFVLLLTGFAGMATMGIRRITH